MAWNSLRLAVTLGYIMLQHHIPIHTYSTLPHGGCHISFIGTKYGKPYWRMPCMALALHIIYTGKQAYQLGISFALAWSGTLSLGVALRCFTYLVYLSYFVFCLRRLSEHRPHSAKAVRVASLRVSLPEQNRIRFCPRTQ